MWVRLPPPVLRLRACPPHRYDMARSEKEQYIVWMDLEMTGLDPENERIIEMATIITDGNLSPIKEGPEIVIHQSDELLEQMDEWNTSHHGASIQLLTLHPSNNLILRID